MFMAWTHMYVLFVCCAVTCEWTTTFSVRCDQTSGSFLMEHHTTLSNAAVCCMYSENNMQFFGIKYSCQVSSFQQSSLYGKPVIKCIVLCPITDEPQSLHKIKLSENKTQHSASKECGHDHTAFTSPWPNRGKKQTLFQPPSVSDGPEYSRHQKV